MSAYKFTFNFIGFPQHSHICKSVSIGEALAEGIRFIGIRWLHHGIAVPASGVATRIRLQVVVAVMAVRIAHGSLYQLPLKNLRLQLLHIGDVAVMLLLLLGHDRTKVLLVGFGHVRGSRTSRHCSNATLLTGRLWSNEFVALYLWSLRP